MYLLVHGAALDPAKGEEYQKSLLAPIALGLRLIDEPRTKFHRAEQLNSEELRTTIYKAMDKNLTGRGHVLVCNMFPMINTTTCRKFRKYEQNSSCS